jgi:16S rRNA (cytidine1402-2'-O)-methyltransferase
VGPTVQAALEHFRTTPPQGEFTIVLGGAPDNTAPARSEAELRTALQALVASGLSRSDAARQLAQDTGLARRELYALLHSAEDPS